MSDPEKPDTPPTPEKPAGEQEKARALAPAVRQRHVEAAAFPPGADVYVVIDDDGQRHVVSAGPWQGRGPRGRARMRPLARPGSRCPAARPRSQRDPAARRSGWQALDAMDTATPQG